MVLVRLITAMVLLTAVSGAAAYQTGVFSTPEFGVNDIGDWGEINNNSIEIVTTAWVNNENPVKLNLSTLSVSYNLYMNDVMLAEGSKNGVMIDKGNQTVHVRTKIFQKKLPEWWASHLQKGEKSNIKVPVKISIDLFGVPFNLNGYTHRDSVQTDIEPILNDAAGNIEGSYKLVDLPAGEDPRVEIRDGSAKWGEVTTAETDLMLEMDIHNPNSYPLPVPDLEGDMIMNEVSVADWNSEDVETVQQPDDQVISPGATRTVTFKAAIDNQKMDDWLTSHIRNGEKTSAQMHVKLLFNVYGFEIALPPGDGMECNFDFQTAILVDNQQSSSNFEGCSTPFTQTVSGSQQQKDQNSSTDNPNIQEDLLSLIYQ